MQKLSKENFYLLLNKYRKMYRNVKVTADACTGCDCDSYCADFSQQNCMSEQCSKKSCCQPGIIDCAENSNSIIKLVEADGVRYLIELDAPYTEGFESTSDWDQGIDSITGLYDMQTFSTLASDLLLSFGASDYDLLAADIRDLKMINTAHGIIVGDAVLKFVSRLLKKHFDSGLSARLGDKFFFLYPSAGHSVRELCLSLREEMRTCSYAPNLNVQFGEFRNVDKMLSVSAICDRALMAVASIKADRNEGFAEYTDELNRRKLLERSFESSFDEAVLNGQFIIYLQPKVNAQTKHIVEAEALVRWLDSDGNLIMPGDFIPVFERDGLICRLDEYVFKKVCLYQKERLDSGKPVVPVSVNLSRGSLYKKNTIASYKKIIDAVGIPYSLVPLELTESEAFKENRIEESISEFVRSGFCLQMDDFGSGYSSLSNLSTLPFSVLKIDKSLIDRIGTPKGEIVVKYTVQIAHDMGLHVVAEGVETAQQLVFLKTVGCDSIQGYFFSRPQDIETFEKLLESGIY